MEYAVMARTLQFISSKLKKKKVIFLNNYNWVFRIVVLNAASKSDALKYKPDYLLHTNWSSLEKD